MGWLWRREPPRPGRLRSRSGEVFRLPLRHGPRAHHHRALRHRRLARPLRRRHSVHRGVRSRTVKVPVSWLREYAAIPSDTSTAELAEVLTAFDLKLEEIVSSGISGPLTVGRVLTADPEEQKNGKTINWCTVDVGGPEPRGIVCGAHNFAPGDLVVVALPGATLPGGFEIA